MALLYFHPLASLLGHAPPSQAHFLWLKAVPSDGRTQAVLFFGESAADEAYHLPETKTVTEVVRNLLLLRRNPRFEAELLPVLRDRQHQ